MQHFIRLLSVLLLLSGSATAQESTSLSPGDFYQRINNAKVQLLDVRTSDEYRSGFIDQAMQANWNDRVEFNSRTQHLDKGRPVFVYCASGGRSAAAAKSLRQRGYDVLELKGGIIEWKKEGLPVKEPEKVKQLTLEEFNAMIKSNEKVLVDFGASWCPPCRRVEPVLNAFEKDQKGKIEVIRIDAGTHTNLLRELNVNELPTFLYFHNGVESARKTGVLSRSDFEQLTR